MPKDFLEFASFIHSEQEDFSIYEKKIAKLIFDNFPDIQSLGSSRGARGKKIAEIIYNKGFYLEHDLKVEDMLSSSSLEKDIYLKRISIKNFRGFTYEHNIEFKNRYTFVYGPNGTGKSSFCEALEY